MTEELKDLLEVEKFPTLEEEIEQVVEENIQPDRQKQALKILNKEMWSAWFGPGQG